MNNTTSGSYIKERIDQFRHGSPRPRDERPTIEEPYYMKKDVNDYSTISDPSNDILNRSSLNQSKKQNPLDSYLNNSASSLYNFEFKPIEPLNDYLGQHDNFNSSVNLNVPSYMQDNPHPSYDNPISRDEFGLSNNNIIPPSSYRFTPSSPIPSNTLNPIHFGITKSSVPPPPDYSPLQEEFKQKLLAELDDSINEISNPIIPNNTINNNNNNNNNIYPPDGLPVTMSPPPQFEYEYNNIQESKYNDNNKKDMKTTSSQIIEDLDVVMLPFKKKMIKQEMIPSVLQTTNTTTTTTTTTIDPPTLHELDNNNELPILSQPLLLGSNNNIQPPDGILAMRKSIEANMPIIQTSSSPLRLSSSNINPPMIQQSIPLPSNNNNNNNNSYLYPPNIDQSNQSFDGSNIKEIDKLIEQLKEENDRIKTDKPNNAEILNELNIERELSDSDDETKTKLKPIKPMNQISYSSPPLNLLNHNTPSLQPQLYPPQLNYNQQQQQQQQQQQLQQLPPYNPYISSSSPPTQLFPSVLPVYGESKVINNTNNNNSNNNMIGSLGNIPIYQAGTTNPSVILATSIRSQPLVTNGIPLPDNTPYINPITAHTISTTISPPLSNVRPNEQQQQQIVQTLQPPAPTPPAEKPKEGQKPQEQQQNQSQPQPTPVTSLPPVVISGIPVSSPRIFDAQPIMSNRNNISSSLYSLQPNYYSLLPQQFQQFQQQQQQQQQQNQSFIPCYQKPQIHSITPVTNMSIQSLYPSTQPSQLPVSNLIPTISPPLPPLVPTSTNNDLKTIPIHPNQFQYVINTIGPNGMIQSTPYTLSDALVANVQATPQPQGPPLLQPLYSSRSNHSQVSESVSTNDQTNINHNVTEKLKSVLDKSAQQRRKFQTQFS